MTDHYVSMAQIGDCLVCKQREDLRCGVCFDCVAKVDGILISPGLHKLWERGNPSNNWFYTDTRQ